MNIHAILNFMTVPVLAIGLTACTSTATDHATHAWYAKEAKTERDYKLDQAQCSDTHQIATAQPMAKDSLSFEGYSNCMMAKGYVLRHF